MAKKKNQNNDNEKKDDDCAGGGKKQNATGVTVVVLKMDLHCEGCAGRVVKAVRTLDGVESVRIGDSELNKITVIGNLDPVKLRQKVEEKTKKKVELISPASKKEKDGDNNKTQSAGDGDNKKPQKQQQPPPEKAKTAGKKNEKKPKEPPVTTAVLKVPLHCQGCVRRIHKLVSKTKGFMEMSVDKNKDLVTVKGGIDMKLLAAALQHKLKRGVEIVPAKKDGGAGDGDGGDKKGKGGAGDGDGGDKKGKGGAGGGGEKKGKGGGGNDGGAGGGGEKKGKHGSGDAGEGNNGGAGAGKAEGYKMESYGGGLVEYPYPQIAYGPGYMVNYVHAPQLFSDENPNACAVM